MKKISEYIKSLGFTFSFKRLRKAIVLVLLFAILGIGIYLFLEFENSESGLKRLYVKEISQKIDLQENTVIKIYKKDINNDKKIDYIFISGEEVRTGDSALNSVVELYKSVNLVVIDGATDLVSTYETKKDFKSDVTLKISEDEENLYFLISDNSGNVSFCKFDSDGMQDIDNNITDIIKNTTKEEFLGYTIYTSKDEENPNIINVKLDNYSKKYISAVKDVKTLDFSELGIDISKYRETYLRDKFSNFKLQDTNKDGIVEFVAYQYILYSLDDAEVSNKTLGTVEIVFDIENDKLKFNRVEVKI